MYSYIFSAAISSGTFLANHRLVYIKCNDLPRGVIHLQNIALFYCCFPDTPSGHQFMNIISSYLQA